MQLPSDLPPSPPGATKPGGKDAALMDKAKELEASFLSEMLSYAGLEPEDGSFSGGIGEQQFGSFLRDQQARMMVEKGGIGLAEQLFRSLVRHDDGRG